MGFYHSICKVFHSTSICIHALILLLSSICLFCLALPKNETDRLALLEVKASITNDPFGVMASWNETNHFCGWHGVTCGHRHHRVTVLDLKSLKLAGSISPHVGNLSFLRKLDLQNNSFTREIPPAVGHLHRLEVLRLNNNSLNGEIPSNISSCIQLLVIDLGFNSLGGTIPEQLGRLSKLTGIGIHFNHLTGSVPLSFANLSSLKSFSAADNNLTGSVPGFFGQLTNLYYLSLVVNSLSGVLPSSIFNLTSIRLFAVTMNKIQGTLPSNLGLVFPIIEHFGISNNQFSGPIPVSLSNASNLFRLEMAGNQLNGKVPSLKRLHGLELLILAGNNLGSGRNGDLIFLCDLINATRLIAIEIQVNIFGGMLPKCIANLSSSSLELFHAHENKISASIPNEIGNLVNLQSVRLSTNQLSGQIPPDMGKLQKLYQLFLDGNYLSGNIPSSFGNFSQLAKLFLHGNKLQGTIPSSLGACHNLINLNLGANNFTGVITQQLILGLFSLAGLDLSQNNVTGSLPLVIGKLINLEYFNVSRNMIFGKIPPNLGSCVRLEYLDMHGNFFQGKIPSPLESLRGLKQLDLSQNNLSGQIPQFLRSFQVLESLNLSYNKFEGLVPTKGVFKNANATSLDGNNQLCGGMPEFHLQKCKLTHSHDRQQISRNLKLLVVSLVFGTFAVTSALVLCYFRFRWRGNKKEGASSDSEKYPKVTYQSLLKATDGFSSTSLIGAGSFGSVYKGVLEQGETTYAIKVLNLVRRGADKSFTSECEALKNIRHRNLLKVISVCSSSDYQGNDFKALIYEFMVNGSLEGWLHHQNHETNERPRNLTFTQRLNVAIDVAMALEYLHNECPTPVVHCDLKPSNVLLDGDMVGHVGDFGLARFLLKASENPSGNQSTSSGVKGTIGYTPPEYGMGHEAWKEGDVYSYGILLLEMFTAKKPTHDMFQGSSNLHSFVKEALPDQVIEVMDPVLVLENVKGDQMAGARHRLNKDNERIRFKIEESLISILEIGVACSVELPMERPHISDIVAQMCGIRRSMK